MQRVALIEPAHSHEEVLFPQIELLRKHFEVHVIAPRSLLDVDLLRDAKSRYRAWPIDMPPSRHRLARALNLPRTYRAIREAIRAIAPDVLIFNSTYSLPEVALIRMWFKNYPKLQIVHNFQRLLEWPARALNHTFDVNLVISEQVHAYVTTHHPEFTNVEYFLPIFFGDFSSSDRPSPAVSDKAHLIRLGVFGSVEQDRRNYDGLLDALRNLGRPLDQAGFRVRIVGKTPPGVEARIREYHLDSIVDYQTDFVPFRTMFTQLEETDIVLFLIDHTVRNAQHYNQCKISGTSTLMKAFRKAGASSTDFPVDDSLRDACFTYPGTDVGHLLRQISDGAITAADIHNKSASYGDRPDFLFTTQEAKLVSIVRRVVGKMDRSQQAETAVRIGAQ